MVYNVKKCDSLFPFCVWFCVRALKKSIVLKGKNYHSFLFQMLCFFSFFLSIFFRKTIPFLCFSQLVISSTPLFMMNFSLVWNVNVWYTHIKGLIDTVLLAFKDFVMLLYLVSFVLWHFSFLFRVLGLLWGVFVSWFFFVCYYMSDSGKEKKSREIKTGERQRNEKK